MGAGDGAGGEDGGGGVVSRHARSGAGLRPYIGGHANDPVTPNDTDDAEGWSGGVTKAALGISDLRSYDADDADWGDICVCACAKGSKSASSASSEGFSEEKSVTPRASSAKTRRRHRRHRGGAS